MDSKKLLLGIPGVFGPSVDASDVADDDLERGGVEGVDLGVGVDNDTVDEVSKTRDDGRIEVILLTPFQLALSSSPHALPWKSDLTQPSTPEVGSLYPSLNFTYALSFQKSSFFLSRHSLGQKFP